MHPKRLRLPRGDACRVETAADFIGRERRGQNGNALLGGLRSHVIRHGDVLGHDDAADAAQNGNRNNVYMRMHRNSCVILLSVRQNPTEQVAYAAAADRIGKSRTAGARLRVDQRNKLGCIHALPPPCAVHRLLRLGILYLL